MSYHSLTFGFPFIWLSHRINQPIFFWIMSMWVISFQWLIDWLWLNSYLSSWRIFMLQVLFKLENLRSIFVFTHDLEDIAPQNKTWLNVTNISSIHCMAELDIQSSSWFLNVWFSNLKSCSCWSKGLSWSMLRFGVVAMYFLTMLSDPRKVWQLQTPQQ